MPGPPNRASSPRRRGGREYVYQPSGMDAWDPKAHHPKPGARVRITKAPGVGFVGKPFAYVENVETGEFHGMVNRASLRPLRQGMEDEDEE